MIEVITVIEGLIIMIFGAIIATFVNTHFFGSPVMAVQLIGVIFIVVGVVVVSKGLIKQFRNP